MANILNLGLSAVATGTADVITATYSPAITLTNRRIVFLSGCVANTTTTPTFNPNALGAQVIKGKGGTALKVGEILGDCLLMYHVTGTYWELLASQLTRSTLAQILANGNTTGDQVISSTDTDSDLFIGDGGEITARVLTTVLQLTQQNLSLTNGDLQLADETASRILSTDANSKVKVLSTTTYPSLTELSYVKGVTSAIQTQLDSKLSAMDYFNVNNLSVVDSTAYFIGQSTTAGTTVNQIPLVPVKAGTVTRIVSEVFSASTIGSSEDGTLEFFYNDGVNSVVISNTFKVDANRHAFVEFSGLNISVNAGNTYFVYTPPVLATNPTGIQFRFNVYMK